MSKVLILNNDDTPICLVDDRRAMRYILDGRVDVVKQGDETISTKNETYVIPQIVKFKESVKIPFRFDEMKWTRTRMLQRDHYTCGYCGEKGNTVDHIFPRSRGGKFTWENTITACRKCNGEKADRTPEEAGMKLLFEPKKVYRMNSMFFDIVSLGIEVDINQFGKLEVMPDKRGAVLTV